MTLVQAVLLDSIYEIIICRRRAKLKGAESFNDPQDVPNPNGITLDFNKNTHLEALYEAVPEEVKAILYVSVT